MDLKEYFDKTKGIGILGTADDKGMVDMAVYAKPHFMEDGTIAFIMADRLTHKNLLSNSHAAYLFLEDGSKSRGKRLFLMRLREEKDSDLLYALRSKKFSSEKEEGKERFLVFFRIDKVLPLIGAGKEQ
ncbi:MAG: pyridoxamine 5'-phosphate oxidase family protein [Deltaproteobacteria bacterium]|nr:pyridoxamine 5'-phosphate oxidase family protein [Deltaproteobacteria bacterium]